MDAPSEDVNEEDIRQVGFREAWRIASASRSSFPNASSSCQLATADGLSVPGGRDGTDTRVGDLVAVLLEGELHS